MTLNLNNKVLKKTLFLKFNTETKLMNHSKKSMIEEKSMNTSIEQNFGDSLRRKFSFHSQSKEDLMLNKEMPESE